MNNEVKISCSLCGGHISCPSEFLWQTIACPHCSGNIVLECNEVSETKWEYLIGKRAFGPCGADQIRSLLLARIINPSTMMRKLGSPKLESIRNLTEFAVFCKRLPDNSSRLLKLLRKIMGLLRLFFQFTYRKTLGLLAFLVARCTKKKYTDSQIKRAAFATFGVGLIFFVFACGMRIHSHLQVEKLMTMQHEAAEAANRTEEARKEAASRIAAEQARDNAVEADREQRVAVEIAEVRKSETDGFMQEVTRINTAASQLGGNAAANFANGLFSQYYNIPLEYYLAVPPVQGTESKTIGFLMTVNNELGRYIPPQRNLTMAFGYSRKYHVWVYKCGDRTDGFGQIYIFLPGGLDAQTGTRYMKDGMWYIDFHTKQGMERVIHLTGWISHGWSISHASQEFLDHVTFSSEVFSQYQDDAWVDGVMNNIAAVIYSYSETEN